MNPGPRPYVPGPTPDGGPGAGGESGTSDDPVRLVGEVFLLNNVAALEATDFVEPADIIAEGVDGEVRGRWNGSDPFSIDGVKQPSIWAEARPLGADALPTVQPVATHDPNASGVVETELVVVSASEIDLALGAISVPLTPDPARAQAILVVTKDLVPAEGVQVTAPGAEAVIYLDSGVYTDTALATDSSGLVVLANVPVPQAGGSYVVTLRGEVTGSAVLRLVPGSVTHGGVGN